MNKTKLTADTRAEAVRIALGGGNHLAYLRKCGLANPSASWSYILAGLQKTDPETYAKLKDRKMKPGVKHAETPEAGKVSAAKIQEAVALPEKAEPT